MYTPELERLLSEMGEDNRARRKVRGGWQQSGQLVVGGSQPVSMQHDFGEVGTYTVGFLQPYAQTGQGDDIGMRAEALIMWNVDGTYKPVRVSLVGGMSVTAAARGVKIIMSDATPDGNVYAPIGTKYNVSCQVARGTRGFSAVAPYYIPQAISGFTQVPNSSQTGIAVPTGSGIQSLFIAVVNSDNTAVNIGDSTVTQVVHSALANPLAASLGLMLFDPASSVNSKWIPLVPGCTGLLLRNNTASKTQLYSIAFGVDG